MAYVWYGAGLLVLVGMIWDRVIRMRNRGVIPRDEDLWQAVLRVTLYSLLAAIWAAIIAALRAGIRQWQRGYSGQPPLTAVLESIAYDRPVVWVERRILEKSGKMVTIHRKEHTLRTPKRRGRPPTYSRQVLPDGREVPGWYARRLTGRPLGRPRKDRPAERPAEVTSAAAPVAVVETV